MKVYCISNNGTRLNRRGEWDNLSSPYLFASVGHAKASITMRKSKLVGLSHYLKEMTIKKPKYEIHEMKLVETGESFEYGG